MVRRRRLLKAASVDPSHCLELGPVLQIKGVAYPAIFGFSLVMHDLKDSGLIYDGIQGK